MNITLRHLNRACCTLAAVGLLGAATLLAAEAPAERPGRDRPDPAGPRGGFGGGLMLDEKQREVLREAVQNHREELGRLNERLRQAQRELAEAMLAEKQDQALIRQKAEAVAKAEVELTLVRAQVIAAVAPTLRPEQRQQFLENPFALNMLTGGMRAGSMMRPDLARPGRPGRDRGQ